MRQLIIIIAVAFVLSVPAFSQCTQLVMNPRTHVFDCIGIPTSPVGAVTASGLRDFASVKDVALCDGVTDEHAVIQTWLNGITSGFVPPSLTCFLGTTGVTIPNTVQNFIVDPSSQFKCANGGTACVTVNGMVGNTGKVAEYSLLVNRASNTWDPITFSGGAGLNDAIAGGTAPASATCVKLTTEAGTDKFDWGTNAGTCNTGATGVSVTGSAQTLSSGTTITFAATTGHTLNDIWTISSTAVDTTSVCVKIAGPAVRSLFHIRQVGNCATGLLLDSTGGDITDNIFDLGVFNANGIMIDLLPAAGHGTNQNVFLGGVFVISSTLGRKVPGSRAVRLQTGSDNQNTFIGLDTQGAVYETAWEFQNLAAFNQLINVRFEANQANAVSFASGSHDNYIQGDISTAAAQPLISDSGTANVWGGRKTTCSFVIGADNGNDLVSADFGPQGRQCFVPSGGRVVEVTVAANAGTPSIIVAKNHAGTITNLISGTLATGAVGAVACAATLAACADGTAKSGVTIVTAGSANVLVAGDWIETVSGVASTGASRITVAITYEREF